ncbi:MAG: septal ring lytic transglycosylase RlpA family protein [Deltaproteobacteria bacterium]|nr:septal ring lytic transglycosylase RlpA family protein [Candidatus Anaeroferrophillacea bacterium]
MTSDRNRGLTTDSRCRQLPAGALLLAAVLLLSMFGACGRRAPLPAAPQVSPADFPPQEGIASWYGDEFHGRPTAAGDIYDMHALTAAHRELPLGSRVRVTNLENRKTVEVEVNDRGPFVRGRIIDLSYGAARRIEMVNEGTALVRIDLLSLPRAMTDRLYRVQLGAFTVPERARDLARRAAAMTENQVDIVSGPCGRRRCYRVQTGRFATRDDAEALRQRLERKGCEGFVVIADQ